MIRSMTGFGRGESTGDTGKFIVEMKSVNHRFSEIMVRMPKGLVVLEDRVRRLVAEKVSRGRVDIFINREDSGLRQRHLKVDKDLAMAYYNALKELGREIGSNAEITAETLTRLPEVFSLEEVEEEADALWPGLQEALLGALASLIAMRETEGRTLSQDLLYRIGLIEGLMSTVRDRAPSVAEEYRRRLEKRLEELLPGTAVDPTRLATEVAMFAERSDITEELKRLESHLEQFRTIVLSGDSVGRKLDFLLQEINREINTIGSKAGDLAIAQAVVEAKSELEKIREQVQNIE